MNCIKYLLIAAQILLLSGISGCWGASNSSSQAPEGESSQPSSSQPLRSSSPSDDEAKKEAAAAKKAADDAEAAKRAAEVTRLQEIARKQKAADEEAEAKKAADAAAAKKVADDAAATKKVADDEVAKKAERIASYLKQEKQLGEEIISFVAEYEKLFGHDGGIDGIPRAENKDLAKKPYYRLTKDLKSAQKITNDYFNTNIHPIMEKIAAEKDVIRLSIKNAVEMHDKLSTDEDNVADEDLAGAQDTAAEFLKANLAWRNIVGIAKSSLYNQLLDLAEKWIGQGSRAKYLKPSA